MPIGYTGGVSNVRESFPPREYQMREKDRNTYTFRATVVAMRDGTVYEFFTREAPKVNAVGASTPDGASRNRAQASDYRWVRKT